MSIFWAVAFAVVLFPFFAYLRREMKSGSLAALITIPITLALVFIPLYALGLQVAQEASSLYQRTAGNQNAYVSAVQNAPFVSDTLSLFGISTTDLTERGLAALREAISWIANEAFSIGAATFSILIQTVVMLYLLFFFLRDGELISQHIRKLLPLGDKREQVLFGRFISTTRAIFKGTVVVALLQGFVGGILFWIAGIPNATLWGSIMAITALIPAIGPAIVWLPAGIILLFMGNVWEGVFVLAGGAVIISLIDNLLRPLLVGRDTQMPDPLILVAMLGGLATFGLGGLIIGPVVAAFFLALWNIFGTEYKEELAERG